MKSLLVLLLTSSICGFGFVNKKAQTVTCDTQSGYVDNGYAFEITDYNFLTHIATLNTYKKSIAGEELISSQSVKVEKKKLFFVFNKGYKIKSLDSSLSLNLRKDLSGKISKLNGQKMESDNNILCR